jgi:hypothetical protein
MIRDRRPDSNRKVLVKGVGENLLPMAVGTLGRGASASGVQAPETVRSTCSAMSLQVRPRRAELIMMRWHL